MKFNNYYLIGTNKFESIIISELKRNNYVYKGTILDTKDLDKIDNNSSILSLVEPIFITKYAQIMRDLNFDYIYTLDYFDIEEGIINNIKKYNLNDKPLLGYIEINLVNHCNLKCKGCTHFSNICDPYEVDLKKFKDDIISLSNLVDIQLIRLMGGEPLLHSKLGDILNVVRMYFPNSKIAIVSNGLLVPTMKQNLIKTIKKNKVIFNISLYQPTFKISDKIEMFLKSNDIKFYYGNGSKQKNSNGLITEFHTCLTDNDNNNSYVSNSLCYGKFFPFVKDGNISRCSYPLLIDYLNKKCNSNFKVFENDYHLIKNFKNGDELINYLNEICSFCKYCTDKKLRVFKWETSRNKDIDQYIV